MTTNLTYTLCECLITFFNFNQSTHYHQSFSTKLFCSSFLFLKSVKLFNPGDISWILNSSSLVMIVIVAIQWFLWGFSLVYSPHDSSFIGLLHHVAFQHLGFDPAESNARVQALKSLA
ncbi:hypothetical protein DFH28DRAFT_972959 [Melampsora americana]|nr:hypothetical protein DFH28DRAFT_972959 [Melampsora americana]